MIISLASWLWIPWCYLYKGLKNHGTYYALDDPTDKPACILVTDSAMECSFCLFHLEQTNWSGPLRRKLFSSAMCLRGLSNHRIEMALPWPYFTCVQTESSSSVRAQIKSRLEERRCWVLSISSVYWQWNAPCSYKVLFLLQLTVVLQTLI